MLLRIFEIYDIVNFQLKKMFNKYKHTGGPTGPGSPLTP